MCVQWNVETLLAVATFVWHQRLVVDKMAQQKHSLRGHLYCRQSILYREVLVCMAWLHHQTHWLDFHHVHAHSMLAE